MERMSEVWPPVCRRHEIFPESPGRPRGPGHCPIAASSCSGALLLYVAAYCYWSLTSHLPVAVRSFRSDLAFLPVGLAVVALAIRAARATGLDARTRRAWRLIATALFCFWLGDVLWFGASWVWPDRANATGPAYMVGQAAYIAYYLPLLFGLLSFPRFLRNRSETLQFWLDVLTVFLGGLMLLWSVLIEPIASTDARNSAALFLAIGLPARRPRRSSSAWRSSPCAAGKSRCASSCCP